MCYSISQKAELSVNDYLEYASGFTSRTDVMKQFEIFNKIPSYYHTAAYEHPSLPVVTSLNPFKIELLEWTLVPKPNRNTTLVEALKKRSVFSANCRDDSMFEKWPWKFGPNKQRGVLIVDGFFENHWTFDENGKPKDYYPYYISKADGSPMLIGCLWEKAQFVNEDTEINSFAIITTSPNDILAKIHNKDRQRMPFILEPELVGAWMNDLGKEETLQIIGPYDEDLLKYRTVPHQKSNKKKGIEALGNLPEAIQLKEFEGFDYSEVFV